MCLKGLAVVAKGVKFGLEGIFDVADCSTHTDREVLWIGGYDLEALFGQLLLDGLEFGGSRCILLKVLLGKPLVIARRCGIVKIFYRLIELGLIVRFEDNSKCLRLIAIYGAEIRCDPNGLGYVRRGLSQGMMNG